MALLDRERGLIVLRIVYDGPPEAGKTTSLRALAGSLGQTVFSPAEQDGRTLFFDWMDYTGGRFEGFQIRCQIVSVPGQRELEARRHHLLREADVVVFVADSTESRVDDTVDRLSELPQLIGDTLPPPVGIVLQANKRDLDSAVPMSELRAQVRAAAGNIAIVESVAADGTGIREAFVFAVRLALDRVREQLRQQSLPVGAPSIESGVELFDEMRELLAYPAELPRPAEPAAEAPQAAALIESVLAENDDVASIVAVAPWRGAALDERHADAPWPPDPSAPSGAIWPPVEGRVILHEAATTRMAPHRLRDGAWAAGLGSGWRAVSSGASVFADLEAGREVLIRAARLHVSCANLISQNRCIVLAATGRHTFRLWQIVRAESSLRDELDSLARCSTEQAAARIVETASILCEIDAQLATAPVPLPCSLDTIGRTDRGPRYIGLLPMDSRASSSSVALAERLGDELGAIFNNELHHRRDEVLDAIARAPRRERAVQDVRWLDQLLDRVRAA